MFFKRKKRLEIDLGELQNKGDSLSSFLRSSLKADVASSGNKLLVDSEKLSPEALKKSVNKFIYHQNLNNVYWVSVDSGVVRINKFKGVKKHQGRKKAATPPSTIRHGW